MKFFFKKIALFFIIAITAFMASGCIPMADEETNKDQVSLGDIQNYINSGSQREYSWYQRVTLTIPTEEGTASGSSVMKITWSENSPRINDAPWIPKITGEMPYVVLSDGSIVLAVMNNERNHIAARFLSTPENIGTWIDSKQLKSILEQKKIEVDISPGDARFPYILQIINLDDPTSISFFQGKASLKVRKTTEGISSPSISNILSWIDELPQKSVRSMPTSYLLPNGGYGALYRASVIGD